MQVKIDSNLPKFGLFVSDAKRRQMPFATKQAINNTAFSVRRHTVKRVAPSAFEERNKRFTNASLRVDLATKQVLRASVFDKLQRGNLEEHAQGGTKTPRGRHVAIPSRSLSKRRSGRGVPKSMRPRTALSRKNVFKTEINGQTVIAERKGKAGKLNVLYVLEKRARLPKRFPFYPQADLIVRTEIGPEFSKEFEKAMRTAKPKQRR